jgi:hypothetical protein
LAGYLISYFLGVLALAVAVVAYFPLRYAASLAARSSGRSIVPLRSIVIASTLGAVTVILFYVGPRGAAMASKSCPRSKNAKQFVTAMSLDSNVLYEITPASFSLRNFSVFFALELLNQRAHFCFVDPWKHYVGRALTCSYQKTLYPSLPRVLVELSIKADAPVSEGKRPGRGVKTIVMQSGFQGGPASTFESVWQG